MQFRRTFAVLVLAFSPSILWVASCGVQAQIVNRQYQTIASLGAETGSSPVSKLLEASDGWLYGTAASGGANGAGTIHKISRAGTVPQAIYSFAERNSPSGSLIELGDGSLYGIMTMPLGEMYSGSIYRINKDGSGFSVLHSFLQSGLGGAWPRASIVEKGGRLFGVTYSGGISNAGTIFSISTNGTDLQIIHHFGESGDGSSPYSSLCLATNGMLFGTTQAGGNGLRGVLFKISTDGTGYTIIHHFGGNATDGALSLNSLVQGTDGVIYGTTLSGGPADAGTIFKVAPDDTYSVLKYFSYDEGGCEAWAGLTQGADGLLYGVTRRCGAHDSGTVFSISPDGVNYQVLHSFGATAVDGRDALGGLLYASDGILYGTTRFGGAQGGGTVFKLAVSVPLVRITGITPVSGAYVIYFADGVAGQIYEVMGTTNRLDQGWVTLGSATAQPNGMFDYTDWTATNYPMRYYRSRLP